MTTRYPSCRRSGGERSNPQAEARLAEPASRNESELDSASLRLMGVTNLPDMVKSATNGEVIPECNHWAPRGDWRQRVGKEKSRNLRDPVGCPNRLEVGWIHSSKEESNPLGAKESNCKHATIKM